MMYNRLIWMAGAACLMTLLTVAQARALRIAPPAPGMRVANADLIVVGKVTGFGAKLVKGEMYKGDDRDMQIAIVKVGDTLLGKAEKEIKVGFFPPATEQPKDGIRPIRGGSAQLKQDEESCLFLVKHPTQKGVYVVQGYFDAIAKKDNPNFNKEVEEVKKAAKLLAKPMDGLKSKDADERFQTAALLISKYRNQRTGEQKTEQVSAEESKLILQALADADWKARNPKFGFMMTPQAMFARLGVTDKEGFKIERGDNYQEKAQKWCKENAGKYRINRFVTEEKKEEKKKEEK
jgi:hypothetical protein